MKQFKMLVQFVRKEATEMWAISIKETISLADDISKLARKKWYEAYLKWEKKEVSDYKPTGEKIEIKTVEDIAKLTQEQFEMFIEDLRNWCNVQRGIEAMKLLWLDVSSPEWMIRLDTGLHEAKLDVNVQVTNKL